MSDEYAKLLGVITELKVKIPSLLDVIDEVISHETRFKSIDEKSDILMAQLKILRKELQEVALDHKTLKDLAEDDRNVSTAINFLLEIVKRKDIDIKEYISGSLLCKKEVIADFVWESLEKRLQTYIGKRILAGGIGMGIILWVLYLIGSYAKEYILK